MMQLDPRSMARRIDPRHKIEHYTSSGSEHDYARDRGSELSEPRSLSDLVESFLEESWEREHVECEDHGVGSDAESAERVESVDMVVYAELKQLVSDKGDHYRNMLALQVHQALETLSFDHGYGETLSFDQQMVLRGVMLRLRSLGHNAAVCKTKWDTSKSGGLVSGYHEFMDVVTNFTTCSNQSRYIIELDFASKFEIAKPTDSYKQLLELLPKAFIVVTEEEMRKIVKVMSNEAKRSLKSKELHLPPWRKNRYMQMKWFGPYKRTNNALPGGGVRSGSGGRAGGVDERWKVEFRAVGFEPVCNGSGDIILVVLDDYFKV